MVYIFRLHLQGIFFYNVFDALCNLREIEMAQHYWQQHWKLYREIDKIKTLILESVPVSE